MIFATMKGDISTTTLLLQYNPNLELKDKVDHLYAFSFCCGPVTVFLVSYSLQEELLYSGLLIYKTWN